MKVSINPAIRLGFWIAVFRLVSSNDLLSKETYLGNYKAVQNALPTPKLAA